MKEISQDWCCELCGKLIKGICENKNGYITHLNNNCEVKNENNKI